MRSNWSKLILMSGTTLGWLLYHMATAAESPGLELAVVQHSLLACALIGLAGSLATLASER